MSDPTASVCRLAVLNDGEPLELELHMIKCGTCNMHLTTYFPWTPAFCPLCGIKLDRLIIGDPPQDCMVGKKYSGHETRSMGIHQMTVTFRPGEYPGWLSGRVICLNGEHFRVIAVHYPPKMSAPVRAVLAGFGSS